MKSHMLASPAASATECSARSLEKLSFSRLSASSIAYSASPLAASWNSISGIRIDWNLTRPPRRFWKSISSSAWCLSSTDSFLK